MCVCMLHMCMCMHAMVINIGAGVTADARTQLVYSRKYTDQNQMKRRMALEESVQGNCGSHNIY